MRHAKGKWVAKGFFFFIIAVGIMGLLTMTLWNELGTPLLELPHISFFQAIGLMILGRLLTGGLGFRGRHCYGPPFRHKAAYWRHRWENMTEEERREMKDKWRNCWKEEPPMPKVDEDELV